ncbi:hypothetical protein N7468_001740 [Penicillium chermesinum]|uniref:ethanolamine kinase n=1 Tax=Penicillium chermesinum TaxID=63820 RepID=A0A9W9TXC9_9EURO|nr:uncharacterized protein N7468_001740 [Penicillium chermesinum]KAJ5246757.1 hypothetical protein N7468_001740 [Penicillium chermesinum]
MGSYDCQNGVTPDLRYIPLSYSHADSQATALRLILTLFPHWEGPGNKVEFVRFTDGITNTLLKIINRKPGLTEEEIDNDAVLMRAYGMGTEVLIDRERTESPGLTQLLAEKPPSTLFSRAAVLLPPLLARFKNGLPIPLYSRETLRPLGPGNASGLRGVARKLGHWHAVLPNEGTGSSEWQATLGKQDEGISLIQPRRAGQSMWAVLQKWILALPVNTAEQRDRRLALQKELHWVLDQLDDGKGIGEDGLVFAHGDLLCANVIVLPSDESASTEDGIAPVTFIDYEYAVPAPAAFDIANHLAEWIGYDCDYNMIPTQSVRRQFMAEYAKSYCQHRGLDSSAEAEIVARLYDDVDRFRGIPGLYWGVWALIQAQISQIDFDYASYAELRLGEYWAWKREVDGSREAAGEEKSLREQRWSQLA